MDHHRTPYRGCHQSQRRRQATNPSNFLNITFHASNEHGIDKYPAKSHAQRLASKLSVDEGLIILSGTPSALYPDSDQPVPFRQDRYFYYLTGCNEPDCYVTYDIAFDTLTLWLPAIDERRVVWTGRGSTVEEAMEKYDIDEARYIEPDKERHDMSTLQSTLDLESSTAKELRHVFSFHRHLARLPFQLSTMTIRVMAAGKGGALKHALDSCRVIKDEHEIELIRRANEVTAAAHTAVFKTIHRLTSEAEVEAAYTAVCITKHAKEQAYAPIAGSGPNAAVLHYGANNEDFRDRQMLVLDAGCEVECYASDVTRTIPLNKKRPGYWPSEDAEEVYSLVEKVQEACIKEMRPGKSFIDIVRLSQRMVLRGLLELGILKGGVEEIEKAGTVTGFYPHGLGHHLGLEVHDVSPDPRPSVTSDDLSEASTNALPHPLPPAFDFSCSSLYSSSGSSAILEPGMVITIEPGIYFNRFLLEKFFLNDPAQCKFIDREVLDRYWKVGGVRIEDDILVTRDGYENLTSTPKGELMLGLIQEGAKG